MGTKQKLMSWFTALFGGELIAKKGVDRQLPFFFFCFVLISLYLIWGLWVEDRMSLVKKNNAVIEDLKIEYHEQKLKLTGLDQRTRIEKMLIVSGNNTLHAPQEPPKRIVIE